MATLPALAPLVSASDGPRPNDRASAASAAARASQAGSRKQTAIRCKRPELCAVGGAERGSLRAAWRAVKTYGLDGPPASHSSKCGATPPRKRTGTAARATPPRRCTWR
eukprot:358731-Chlamydomonas_euryale.AAC.5